MCWKSEFEAVKETAEVDIEVYKILEREEDDESVFYAPYYKTVYRLGRVLATNIGKPYKHHVTFTKFLFRINEGLHSYSKDCITLYNGHIYINAPKSHIPLDWWNGKDCYKSYVIVKCAIPKGSKYYYNSDGLYVSNKLLPIEVVNFSEFIN